MRLHEITNSGRKTIKKLSSDYMEFLMNDKSYDELINFVRRCLTSVDTDVRKEARRIYALLSELILQKISKPHIENSENDSPTSWMDSF